MGKLKHNFKKGITLVLSLAMVAGLVLAMSGGANTVQAAAGTGTQPSVTAYATKDQLMDDTFKPKDDGTADNYGKLVFGKNSSGSAQEWYILGKDDGVSGDNTIIFAASPIATGQRFEDDWQNNKTTTSLWSDCVYNGTSISEVSPNHYGASDLRVTLKNMTDGSNETYFTTAEQGLMNDTTVTTKDLKNSATYTTTDKLYALAADGYGSSYKTIKAGSDNNTVLAINSYWGNGDEFWLRSPYSEHDRYALSAIQGRMVYYGFVNIGRAVQPASNLNLSSVLFASAAKAASSDTAESGTIPSDKAMTLRLDGTGKNIGTAIYNSEAGTIEVRKGSTSQTVALVVQGKDGTGDWYYSKQITGTETVTTNASDIKTELSLSSDIDLSACKIWLETTDSDSNLTYAVNANDIISIASVEITGIDTPAANTTLDTSASCATTGVKSTTPQITWTPSDTTAGYNTRYTASITLTADIAYKFADNVTAIVSGNNATSVTKNADGTLTVTKEFTTAVPDDKKTNGSDSGNNADDSQQITAPQTGDNSHPMLWVTLLAVPLAGLLALLSLRRKKDDE